MCYDNAHYINIVSIYKQIQQLTIYNFNYHYRMTLRQLDFRNAKYQGYANRNIPNGFGFLLDNDYRFIASYWNNNNFNGPTLIVLQDSTIIYGNIKHNKQQGLLVYEKADILMYKLNTKIVIDLTQTKVLMLVQGEGEGRLKYRVVKQQGYSNKEEKYESIGKMLKVRVQNEYRGYRNFIMQHYKNRNRELVQIYDNNKEYVLSYRVETLFVKLSKNSNQVLSMGYKSDKGKNLLEIGRKYIYTYNDQVMIEQGIYTDPQIHIEYTYPQRPIQCVKNINEYYKKSLTFVNKFFNIHHLQSIKQEFESAKLVIKETNNNKNAQGTLENNGFKEKIKTKTQSNFSEQRNITIEDIRNEIKRTRDKSYKKQTSNSRSINTMSRRTESQQRTPNREVERQERERKQRQRQRGERQRKERQREAQRQMKDRSNERRRRSSKVDSPIRQLNRENEYEYSPPAKRRKTYDSPLAMQQLKERTPKRSNNKRSPKKYVPESENLSPYHTNKSRHTINTNVNGENRNRSRRVQNLQKLTSDYRYIEQEIKETTPKSFKQRTPYKSKFNYLQEANVSGWQSKKSYQPSNYF